MKEPLSYDLGALHQGKQRGQVRRSAVLNFNCAILQYLAGLFFILPCMDSVKVVDLRTVTFDVPPQEVWIIVPVYSTKCASYCELVDFDKGQCYSAC